MKDILHRCLNFGDRFMNRFEAALGGFSLDIACSLTLTSTGIIKFWFFILL